MDERQFINLEDLREDGASAGEDESNNEQEVAAVELDEFGITGTLDDDDSGLYYGVNIYFVDSSGNCENVSPPVNNMREDFWGYPSEETIDTGNGKFIIWELYANGSGSLSYIPGVRDGMIMLCHTVVSTIAIWGIKRS